MIRHIAVALLYASIPTYYWLRMVQTFPAQDIIRPTILFAVSGVFLGLIFGRLMRNKGMGTFASAIPATFFLVLFGGYIAPIAIIICSIALLFIEKGFDYKKITFVILASSLFSLAFPALRFFESTIEISISEKMNILSNANLNLKASIWHTILDGYGSENTLNKIYSIDSKQFLNSLHKNNFIIFENAISPYNQTLPTMASIFSLEPAISEKNQTKNLAKFRASLGNKVSEGSVVSFLKENHYRIFATKIGYRQLEFKNQNIINNKKMELNELEASLLGIFFPSIPNRQHNELLRTSIPIAPINGSGSPFFLYQHILAPHPPFTIDSVGNDRSGSTTFLDDGSHFVRGDESRRKAYIDGYREKALYIQSQVLQQIKMIPRDDPLIIIIQGDHGPGAFMDHESATETCLSERMTTFLAIYTNIPKLRERLIELKDKPYVTLNLYRTIFSGITDTEFTEIPFTPEFLRWSNPWAATPVSEAELNRPCLQ